MVRATSLLRPVTAENVASSLILGAQGGGGTASVTQGMTLSATWGPEVIERFELDSVQAFSFRMDITLNSADEGILFEAGGSGSGLIVYHWNGAIYFQAGDGTAFGEASNRGEASWTIPASGTYSIEGSADAQVGLRMYVDGSPVGPLSSFSNATLAGTDRGGVKIGYGANAANRGSFVPTSSEFAYPGEVIVSLFIGQTTPDIV